MKVKRIILLTLVFLLLLASPALAAKDGNDTMHTAQSIRLSTQVNGSLSDNMDHDWYKVQMPVDGYFRLQFAHPAASRGSWFLYLRNAQGEVLKTYSYGYKSPGSEERQPVGIPRGTYYLEVKSGSGVPNVPYSLKLNAYSAADWETEQNDINSYADPLPVGGHIKGALQDSMDEDWYFIETGQSGNLTLRVKALGLDRSCGWKITFYDRNARVLYTRGVTAGHTNTQYMPGVSVKPGVYYVKVENGVSYTEGTYHLYPTFQGNPGTNPNLPQNQPIRTYVNGKQVQYDQPPIIINGRTMVPVRATFNAMGATVHWNEAGREIISHRGNMDVFLWIDSNTMMTHTPYTHYYKLDVAPTIRNGRTLIPLRAVAEAFRAEVVWNPNDRTVHITL